MMGNEGEIIQREGMTEFRYPEGGVPFLHGGPLGLGRGVGGGIHFTLGPISSCPYTAEQARLILKVLTQMIEEVERGE